MAAITIAIQANPDTSAIVVGAVRVVVDVAVKFIRSEMFCRFRFSWTLAEHAQDSAHEELLLLEALANVYGNLLQLCEQAHEVFAKQGFTYSFA